MMTLKGPHGVHRRGRIDLVRSRIHRVETVRNALRTSACDALLLPGSTAVEVKPGTVFAVEPLVWVPDVRGGVGSESRTWS